MATNATHVSQIYTIHITSCLRGDRVFCFLLGEKPKMATNAHPRIADFHNTHYILPERRQNRKFLCFSLIQKTQDGVQCPRVADLHNTYYILPDRRQNRKMFCFLLGEKPQTNAHVAQIFTIHITSCQKSDRTGRLSVFF
jgi:hypothetical protein